MLRKAIAQLTATLLLVFSLCSYAEAQSKNTEQLLGKWDSHAGIVSFFTKVTEGEKQIKLLAVDEHAETKIAFDLMAADVEDLEELVESTISAMGNPDTLPIPPLGTKEVVKNMGSLIYPTGKIKISIVDPAGTSRYVSMIVSGKDKKIQCVYWMEKEDVESFKVLLEKVMNVFDKT